MLIVANYDSSMSSAPAGYQAAIASAISYLDTTFVANITINVNFGWGEVDGQHIGSGALGENIADGNFYTYAQLRSAMVANAADATEIASLGSLPAADPNNGGQYWVTDAMAANLGLIPASTSIQAWVGLSSSSSYTFDPNNRAVAGKYDAIGTLEHELSEVMGRLGFLGKYFGNGATNDYGPIDLFRYSSPGVRDTSGNGYFSADGGHTLLTQFNNPRNGGDVADWNPDVQGDSFGDGYLGTASPLSATDLKVMDVLGYKLAGAAGTVIPPLTFTSTAANDVFTGNGAVDTAVYHGTRAQYTVSGTYPVLTVADSVPGRDGTDSLSGIAQVKFTDVTLVFDLQSSQDKLVYELYQAAFARTPDNSGFRYWAATADSTGASAIQLADQFLSAPEFTSKYGSPPNATFVSELYTNVLGRAPDAAGLAYWTQVANAGTAHDALLVDFATSAENIQTVTPHISNGYWTV